MIGKIRKGRSFSGCIRYVTQKDDAKIIASEGVLLGTVEETARSFRWQCLLNPDVAKPVGHIALSFKPEDAPRLTDAFMARLAEEYLELMGIRNTQFIVVCEGGIHVVYGEGEVDFVVAEVVWAVHVAKPGELELMNGASITEVDELKTSVSSIFFADYGESECIFVELN